MDIENIIKLVDAGFTKEEILALNSKQEPQDEPIAPEAPEVIEVEKPNKVVELENKITRLEESIHKNNIEVSEQPQKQETVDDILASLLQ